MKIPSCSTETWIREGKYVIVSRVLSVQTVSSVDLWPCSFPRFYKPFMSFVFPLKSFPGHILPFGRRLKKRSGYILKLKPMTRTLSWIIESILHLDAVDLKVRLKRIIKSYFPVDSWRKKLIFDSQLLGFLGFLLQWSLW